MPRGKAIINSTSAEAERLEAVPPVAVEFGTKLIGLTMAKEGIPVSAEARVSLALEKLVPRCEEVGLPLEHLIVDPLVLTVKGCQEFVPQCVEAVRILKQSGLPLLTNAGLSNVSNQVPPELRPLINRTYMVMLMAVLTYRSPSSCSSPAGKYCSWVISSAHRLKPASPVHLDPIRGVRISCTAHFAASR